MVLDPVYFLFMAPALILSFVASRMTKSRFEKYSRVRSAYNLTGAQAAKAMLDHAGIHDVKIVRVAGQLSDHYNPMNKTLALSDAVHDQPSVAAIGVACHEAGHAIQHATKYAPLWVRSALVPTVGIGSNLGFWGMAIGAALGMNGLIMVGAVLFSAVLLFQIVTLPVEFDASARAKKHAFAQGLIAEQEREGVAKVLNAAALTYVAAAVSSLMMLLYFLMRARD